MTKTEAESLIRQTHNLMRRGNKESISTIPGDNPRILYISEELRKQLDLAVIVLLFNGLSE